MRGIATFDSMMNFRLPEPQDSTHEQVPAYSVGHLLPEGEDTGHNPAPYLFKESDEQELTGIDDQFRLMDEVGVTAGLTDISIDDPHAKLKLLAEHPTRLYGCVAVNPHNGMSEIRKLERMVAENPNIRACAVLGQAIERPYNDKIYYPLYAKACELNLPVVVYVGIPGPLVPGAVQHPLSLDEVMWFFPELTVVMRHGGEPWEALCAKLLLKWQNLYYATSGFAPKYYPKAILDFANTRGADKIMYAGYTPMIPFSRIASDMEKVELREHVWPKFLYENAASVFKF